MQSSRYKNHLYPLLTYRKHKVRLGPEICNVLVRHKIQTIGGTMSRINSRLNLRKLVQHTLSASLVFIGQQSLAAKAKSNSTELSCGDVVTSSVRMNRDLDCRDYLGAALVVSGKNIQFDGRQYKILVHPDGVGVHLKGDGITFKNTKIEGATRGRAIYAEAGKKLRIQENNLDNNMIGIHLFANASDVERAEISENSIRNSAQMGILISSSGESEVVSPIIKENDLSGTQGTAIHANAARLRLTDSQDNNYDGSRNAIYFSGKRLVVDRLDLSQAAILESTITLMGSEDVTIRRSNLSSLLGPSESGTRIGINAYKVQQLTVQNSVINDQDVAVKVATEQGIQTVLRVQNSIIQGSALAGVMIQSFDQTEFGTVKVRGNDIAPSNANLTVWLVGNTVLGPKSKILL